MRFLPEQKNKRLRSVLLLVIAVGGIIYFNFFAGPPSASPRPPGEAYPPANPAAATSPAAGGGAKPAVRKSQGGLLPYGAGIDTAVIEQEKFKALRATAPFTVAAEELGRSDLFAR